MRIISTANTITIPINRFHGTGHTTLHQQVEEDEIFKYIYRSEKFEDRDLLYMPNYSGTRIVLKQMQKLAPVSMDPSRKQQSD